MSKPDNSLTLRMRATTGQDAPESQPEEIVVYHWGRIFGALAVLALLLAPVGWYFWSSPETAEVATSNAPAPSEQRQPPEDELATDKATAVETAGDTMQSQQSEVPAMDGMADPEDANASAATDDTAESAISTAMESTNNVEPVTTETTAEDTAAAPGEDTGAMSAPEAIVATEQAQLAENTAQPATTGESTEVGAESDSASTTVDSQPGAANIRITSDHLQRATLTRELLEKEPVGELPGQVTMNDDGIIRVYFFNHLSDLKDETLFHDWYRNDERVARVTIRPYSNLMRASSAKYINRNMLGEWRVEAITADGNKLGSGEFQVVGNAR